MISIHFQGISFNITVIQVYALTSKAEEAEIEWFTLEVNREIILSLLRLHPSTAFWTLVDYEGYSISSKGF